MTPRTPTGRRGRIASPLAPYAHARLPVRLHTAVRWWSAPLAELSDLLPPAGHILDYGCGHGLLSLHLVAESDDRHVYGVDVDHAKVRTARQVVSRMGALDERVEFDAVAPSWRPPADTYDAVVVVDVLYLLGHQTAVEVLRALAASLVPGGRLVVKEMSDTPRWKANLNRAQEQFAVRVARITAGSAVDLLPPSLIEATLAESGLSVRREPLDRHYLHPHTAWVSDRAE